MSHPDPTKIYVGDEDYETQITQKDYIFSRLEKNKEQLNILFLDVMDMIHEVAEEIVGDKHLTNEELEEYLNSAKYCVINDITYNLEKFKDSLL